MICIWCGGDFAKLSIEHAIPEALACPPDLILRDVACVPCNNGFSKVDRALVRQFEAISVMYGIPRKRGRKPTIDGWSALASSNGAEGPEIHVNAGPGIIEAAGKKLHPASVANGITNVWMKAEEGRFGFDQQFGNDPLFLPSLYKIGLNLVARHLGSEVAASASYAHIRAFVRGEFGAPRLTAAMNRIVVETPISGASGPLIKPGRAYPMFSVTVLGVAFLLDLAPDQSGLRDIRGAATLHGDPMYVFPERLVA